jgi:AbrB family looped-hinge helix DNA binding protein
MVEIAISKISSKGQIVIPKDLRKNFKKDSKVIIIKRKDSMILKNVEDLDVNFEEDLLFAMRTEEALKRCERSSKLMEKDQFFEELDKW